MTCSCGHDFDEHQGIPPYTGPEWCEGGWWVMALDVDGELTSLPTCGCREFEGAFE